MINLLIDKIAVPTIITTLNNNNNYGTKFGPGTLFV